MSALLDHETSGTRSKIRKNSGVWRRWSLKPHELRCALILLLSFGMMAALAGPFLAGRIYTADDLGAFHLPMRAFYADCLARGEPFDWSPQLFCGFYLTGEGQIGGYHPLHLLLYRFLPLSVAFDLECLISSPFIFLGMFLLLRRWRVGRSAALFGALTFAFSGFSLLHFIHVNAIAVVAHLPWLLLAIDCLLVPLGRGLRDMNGESKLAGEPLSIGMRGSPTLFAGISLALLIGSQLLLGYPQYVCLSAVAEVGYAALLIWPACGGKSAPGERPADRLCSDCRRNVVRRLLSIMGWIGLGILIGAVQLLPTFDALQESSRQSANEEFTAWGSLDPLNLIQLVAPYLFKTRVVGQNTHELGLYAGAATLVLAVYCLSRRAKNRRLRQFKTGAAALVALGFLLAFGEHGPVQWLVAHAPLVNRFRFPCRAIVLVHFGLALLAALGFAALVGPRQCIEAKDRGAKSIWIVAGLSIAAAIAGPLLWPDYVASPLLVCVGPFAIATAAWLLTQAKRGARWALMALAAASAIDLGTYGMSYAVYRETPPLDRFLAFQPCPPGTADGRLALDLASPIRPALHAGNQLLLRGYRRADGYAGLEPASQLDYRQTAALRIAGVQWVAEGAHLAERSALSPATPGWLAVSSPLPRARLVSQVVESKDPAIDIARIRLESTALVEQPLDLEPGPKGIAEISTDQPGDIRLVIESPSRQLLVMAERYHAGWQATASGKPLTILRVNGDFMGCIVGPGRSDIEFQFRPPSLQWGRWLSLLGLGLVGVVAVLRTGIRENSERR